MLGIQCWSPPSADLALSSDYSQVGLVSGSRVVEPIHNVHNCRYGHFVHELIGQCHGWMREKVDWTLQKRSSHPLDYLNIPLMRAPLGEHSHATEISSCFSSIQRGQSTYLSPRPPCHQLLNDYLSMALTIQATHGPQPLNRYIVAHLSISPSTENE